MKLTAREFGIEISGIAGRLLRALRQQVAAPDEALRHLARLRESGRINRRVFSALEDAINDEA